jgi:aspartyl/asparaginyl beta-hydroxylase (cupin superfamily)
MTIGKSIVVGAGITATALVAILIVLYIKQARVFSAPLSLYFLKKDPNPGYVDKEKYFPGYKLVEDNWKIIQTEYFEFVKRNSLTNMYDVDKVNVVANLAKKDGNWQIFVLQHSGKWLEENCKYFPETTAILKQCPEINRAMFSVFKPRSFLKTHRAFSKTILRYLLGIVVPTNPNPYIIVDGQREDFEEGKGIMFDDTYLHSSHNDNDQPRVVLFLDITRPTDSKVVSKLMNLHDKLIQNSPWYKNYTSKTEKQHDV